MSTAPKIGTYTPRPLGNDPARTVDYPESERYVQLGHITPIETDAVLIKAPMGTGKSTFISSYINSAPYSNTKVIVIGPRKSFEVAITGDLNSKVKGTPFKCYLNVAKKKQAMELEERLVIQFESLFKLGDEWRHRYETVVIDECESVLTQAVAYETNKDNLKRNQATFVRLLRQAKHVFLMDAFLSDRTIRFVEALGLSYKLHNYQRKPVAREAIRYDSFYNLTPKQIKDRGAKNANELRAQELEEFLGALVADLRAGRRVYFFVSSKGKVQQIMEALATSGLPSLRVKVYHSQSDDKATDLTNVREEWSQADLVITTCTITVGCNYDYSPTDHPQFMFDSVYMYASASSKNLVRDMFQAHMRVRHLRLNELHFFLDPTPTGLKPAMDRRALTEYVRALEKDGKALAMTLGKEYAESEEYWKELYIDALEEHNASGRAFQEMFLYYLGVNNYTCRQAGAEDMADEEIELEALPNDAPPYDEVPELTLSEVKALKQQRMSNDPAVKRLTPMENSAIDRFYFDRSIQEDLQDERRAMIWGIYHKLGRERFLNCRFEKGQKAGLVTLSDMMSEGRGDLWNTSMALRTNVINRICKALGLRNTVEVQSITSDKWEQVAASADFQKLEKDARTAFGMARKTSKPITWVSKSIEEWSGSKLAVSKKRVQRRVGGVVTDVTPLNLKPVDDDLWTDLTPRKSRRNEQVLKEEDDREEEERRGRELARVLGLL